MIKVFLIESQKIVREGIKVLLEEEEDFQVFTCENKDVKVSLINHLKPDLILISLDNLDEEDFSYLNIFLELNKNRHHLINDGLFKIVVYAEKVNEFLLNKVLNIGCQGYLLKESSIEELKQAIRSVSQGYKHIGNSVFSQIKQLSIAVNEVASETNVAVKNDNYDLGLQISGNLGSDELNQGNFKHDSWNFPSISQEKIDRHILKVSSIENQLQLPGKPQKRWAEVSKIMLLMALSSIAGISAAWAYSDRIRSFSPITKYGKINSNTLAIKTPHSGKIAQIDYQIGDLVEVNDVVARIEPETIQLQQDKDATAAEIEQTKQQIQSVKQLLARELNQLQQKQQKLEELLSSKIGNRDELRANSLPQLNRLKSKVAQAYKNYQSLQKLSQQNIVSESELARARQTWLNAQRELIQMQNSQRQSKEAQITELKIERELQQEINGGQNKVSKREKTIEILSRDLTNLQNRLQQVNNELLDSSKEIALKAPSKGIVQQIANPSDRIVDKDETIFNLLSCQNLWVEVNLSGEGLRQINFQQPVAFELEKHRHNFIGKISSVESAVKFNKTKLNLPYYKTSISHSYLANDAIESEMMFKVVVNFPLLENYMQQQELCGVGNMGLITFNK